MLLVAELNIKIQFVVYERTVCSGAVNSGRLIISDVVTSDSKRAK
jgi:hypothetical protein